MAALNALTNPLQLLPDLEVVSLDTHLARSLSKPSTPLTSGLQKASPLAVVNHISLPTYGYVFEWLNCFLGVLLSTVWFYIPACAFSRRTHTKMLLIKSPKPKLLSSVSQPYILSNSNIYRLSFSYFLFQTTIKVYLHII